MQSLCGICTQRVKTGEGKAIFTAECSHTFHFPCIAAHVQKEQTLTCPVCSTNWNNDLQLQPERTAEEENTTPTPDLKTTKSFKQLQAYNDDEPLLSPVSVSRFNTIPEYDENEEEDEDEENKEPVEFEGFFNSLKTRTFEAFLLPEAAIVASNRSFETVVAVLKVKAKPCDAVAHRPPVDLVTVLDVGGSVSGEELWMLKRSMHVVISSLGSADRLSVVAFSDVSKRLFPLRRMTGRGRRVARRVVESLNADEYGGDGAPARKDAMRKAAKVLEDRRQRNTVAKIFLLSNDRRLSLSSARYSRLGFPVHALSYSQQDGAFAERVGKLLHVVAQDLRLELQSASGEIAAVYSPGTGLTAEISPDSAVIGDLHSAEERELLVELKVPSVTASRGSHNSNVLLSVRSSYCDPFTQELVPSKERAIVVPRPRTVRSSDPKIQRLIDFHVSARTVAESRRLLAHNDVSGALHLLSSARAAMIQSYHGSAHEWLQRLEAELRRREQQQQLRSQKLRINNSNCLEEKLEPLTPMSAWRAAERLAKVAIMRKSMSKVSDLHGFENAGF